MRAKGSAASLACALALLTILSLFALKVSDADLAKAEPLISPDERGGPQPGARANQLGQSYARLPLSFEPNRGQADPRVNFFARPSGYSLFLTADEAVLRFKDVGLVRMKLAGSDPRSSGQASEQLSGISNYFVGNDPAQWERRRLFPSLFHFPRRQSRLRSWPWHCSR